MDGYWLKIKRVLTAGFINFWRNAQVSFTSLLVMSATLFVIATLVLGGAMLDASLAEVKDKVDVNAYLRLDAPEQAVLLLRDKVADLPEVKSVEYISREEALTQFKARHENNSLIIQSLEEVGDNPLGAVLNIRANDPSQYETIAKFLESDVSLDSNKISLVDKVNYRQNKVIIDRLTGFADSAQQLGYGIALVFVVMAVAVTFNTIRLAIYTAREEISVMRLVGASNNYVRGPFIVEGLMYGLISATLVLAILYPVTLWTADATRGFFGGLDLHSYYLGNIIDLIVVVGGSGLFLGTVSSFLAVRRYLKT